MTGKRSSLSFSIIKTGHGLYQDDVTVWDVKPWYQQSSLPIGQHYKVIMIAFYHKLLPVTI